MAQADKQQSTASTSNKQPKTVSTVVSRLAALAGWLTAASAAIAAFVGLYATLYSETNRSSSTATAQISRMIADTLSVEINKQRNDIKIVKDDMQKLEQRIASLSSIPKEDALNIEIQKLGSSVGELSSREAKIELVILDNPSKALEMPLLKRDIDNIKESHQSSVAALKDSIDRIYDLSKWLLGAMAVSIVTLAASSFLKSRDTKSE